MVLIGCIPLLLFFGVSCLAEFKLSDSKLLLPYFCSTGVNYTITGSGGSCYEWWSGTPEVVTVVPISYAGKVCADKASVTAVWQSTLRRTATVYARDFVTKHVLKCDVIVDDIHNIKVDTTTQELYLHNTPESLVVIGYDEFGNTFSSLDGIPFEWKIHPGSENDSTVTGGGVLRFLTWTESEYTTPSRIGLLEADGMQGYMQLVSGLRTGSGVVSAALRESAYSHVPPAQVRLLVMANAQLNPPLLYLTPNSVARLQVNVVRQDADEEIMMPSRQYYLSVADKNIIELDGETGSTITAKKYGQTTVILLDKNVENAVEMLGSDTNDTEAQLLAHHRRPTSIVNVVEPAYFRFSIQPVGEDAQLCVAAARQSSYSQTPGQGQYNHWTLETGKKYNLFLDLYDQDNHRIFPADNICISVLFPNDDIKAVKNTQNGTIYTIVPLTTGTHTVKAILEGVITKAGEMKLMGHPITGSQELIVYSPIQVFPSQANIALDVSVNASGGYVLAAEGGSGGYVWTVLPVLDVSSIEFQPNGTSDVVTVSTEGVLFAKGIGSALVVVSDLRNPGMCSHSTIRVNHLISLNFSPGRVEVYLPGRSLFDTETRLSSLLSARSILRDAQDLIPSPPIDRDPLNQHEKDENAVLSVGLKAQDAEGHSFTYCHNLPIQVRPKDSSIVKVLPGIRYLPSTIEGFNQSSVCAFVHVVGLTKGFTELEVFYFSGKKSEEEKAHAKFPIAVYEDISFLPKIAVVAVAVGSSRRISFIKGPSPWRLAPDSHFVELRFGETAEGKANPSVHQRPRTFVSQKNSSISGHNFVLRCESSGSFEIIIVVGNRPSSTNPLPAVLSAAFSLICDFPSKIELVPLLHLPTLPPGLPPCSRDNAKDIIPIPNGAPLKVEVIFKNSGGYQLSGVDSVEMRAQVTSDTGNINEIVSNADPVVLGSKQLDDSLRPNNPYFIIKPRTLGESAGILHVRVDAKYKWPGEPSGLLKSILVLKMAPQVTIEPRDNFQLLLHPKAFAKVHLAHGSGLFHFEVLSHDSTSKLANQPCLSALPAPNHEGDDRQLQRNFFLSPICKGKVTIRATDLCFPADFSISDYSGQKSVEIGPSFDDRLVSVVGLGSLHLYAPSQLELFSKAPAYVRAFDTDGNVLSAHFANLLDLQVLSSTRRQSETDPAFVSHHPSQPTSSGLGLPSKSVSGTQFWLSTPSTDLQNLPGLGRLDLFGQDLGQFKLKVISGPVISNVEAISVYAPLSLQPCNLNLLLGAAHRIVTSGGPSSSSITFQVTPEHPGRPKLSVKQVGEEGTENGILLRAELGQVGGATVSAMATSPTGYAGLDTLDFESWDLSAPPKILFSNTSCQMNVVALSGIRIGCPLPAPSHNEARVLVTSASESSITNGVPVWAEGIASVSGNSIVVTPMGLADIRPPLHFSWRLSPPMPSSPANLFYWLSHLNVEPDDTFLSSGIVLVGVAPGQVKLHLTVFTDDDSLTGQLISAPDSRGNLQPVKKISTEIVFSLVPHLSLLNPPRQNPRILVSPNSRLQLKIPPNVLVDGSADYSVECPSNASSDMIKVTSNGLLESSVQGRCGDWSDWRLTDCRCLLRIDYRATAIGAEGSERSRQSIALDVVVKPPLYTLARAHPEPHSLAKSNSGLPFGGPYPITLSFHDKLGETFDAVSEDLLSIRMRSHRSGLLDCSVEGGWSTSQPSLGRLMLRVTPPLHSDLATLQSTAAFELTHDSLPGSEESAILAPIYLTVPIGSLLDVHGISEFTIGQWACLPILPQGDGVWSSSDPNLLWIDDKAKFMLPLRSGHVHLQFTPRTLSGVQTSLLGKLTLKNTCSKFNTNALSRLISSSIMPVGFDSIQEVPIHFALAPVTTANSSCASGVEISTLSAISPLMCSVRLELGASGGDDEQNQVRWISLPYWLRGFLLAEHYATTLSVMVDPDLVAALKDSVVQSADFQAQLIPSVVEEGAWTCVIRSGEPGDYSRLAVVPQGTHLVVEVTANCGTASDNVAKEAISRSELTLAPAFRLLVPSMHLSNTETLALTPRAPTANLLVFIPPATLAQMESVANTDQALKARSQRPDLLAIASAPRPVYSAGPVSAALERMASEYGYASRISDLLRNLSHIMENEAQASTEKAFGNGLVWTIGIKSLPTKTAIDVVVNVVLSLKITGQHVSVPIRVQTRAGGVSEASNEDEEVAREGFWINISWLHLLLLVLLTILLLLASHVVARSLSGAGFGDAEVQKNLPPLPFAKGAPNQSSPRLWSQSFGQHAGEGFTSPAHSLPRSRTLIGSSPSSSPLGDIFDSYSLETPNSVGRFRGVSSPSRLREAFDNSL